MNPRQVACYNDLCGIYRSTRTPNTDGIGTPGAEVITKIASATPCHFEQTANLDDPTGIGRIKRPSVFTTDVVHLSASQDVRDGDWIRNETPGPRFGDVYKAMGAPYIVQGSARRPANKQSFMLAQEEHPPDGIP